MEDDSHRSDVNVPPEHRGYELLRIISKADEEPGLNRPPPTEPEQSRLLRRQSASPQRPIPFFPEVHERGVQDVACPIFGTCPHLGLVNSFSIDGADLQGYSKLPPIGEDIKHTNMQITSPFFSF